MVAPRADLVQELKSPLVFQEPVPIRIRPANQEDIELLSKLWLYQRQYHEQWDNVYAMIPSAQQKWEEQLKEYLSQSNHRVLIAENMLGEIVGYVHGSFHPWPMSPFQHYGSLNTISVTEEAQDQGIGKKLVKTLLEWFETHQIQYISLHVDYRNQIALKLYHNIGFRSYQQRLMLNLAI
ncbi:MAG: GNAT family N-acetyltransferase [Candidatus Hermodarchaeota archaeon]